MGEKEKVQKAKNYLISNQSQLRFKKFSLSLYYDGCISLTWGFANIAQALKSASERLFLTALLGWVENKWKDIEIRKGLFTVLPKECHQIVLSVIVTQKQASLLCRAGSDCINCHFEAQH